MQQCILNTYKMHQTNKSNKSYKLERIWQNPITPPWNLKYPFDLRCLCYYFDRVFVNTMQCHESVNSLSPFLSTYDCWQNVIFRYCSLCRLSVRAICSSNNMSMIFKITLIWNRLSIMILVWYHSCWGEFIRLTLSRLLS